jgi:hypothetical protein
MRTVIEWLSYGKESQVVRSLRAGIKTMQSFSIMRQTCIVIMYHTSSLHRTANNSTQPKSKTLYRSQVASSNNFVSMIFIKQHSSKPSIAYLNHQNVLL